MTQKQTHPIITGVAGYRDSNLAIEGDGSVPDRTRFRAGTRAPNGFVFTEASTLLHDFQINLEENTPPVTLKGQNCSNAWYKLKRVL